MTKLHSLERNSLQNTICSFHRNNCHHHPPEQNKFGRRRGRTTKILLFVYILLAIGCCYQVGRFFSLYFEYSVDVNLQLVYRDKIEAPAITLCVNNQGYRELYCKAFPDNCYSLNNISQFCKNRKKFCSHYSEKELLTIKVPLLNKVNKAQMKQTFYRRLLIPKMRNILNECRLPQENSKKPCWVDYIFPAFPYLQPPRMCYVYNTFIFNRTLKAQTTPDDNYVAGQPFLYSYIEWFLPYYMIPSDSAEGQLLIHSPYGLKNPVQEGFSVEAGYEYSFFVNVVEKHLLPDPYTTACIDYLKIWQSRGYKGPLDAQTCLNECLANISLERCGCVDKFMFRFTEELLCVMNKTCMASRKEKQQCRQKCQKPCYSLEFEIVRTEIRELSSTLLSRIRSFYLIENKKYSPFIAKTTWSFFKVFMNRPEILIYKYKPRYEVIEIFSYLGGYIGIWLGLSIYAVFKAIYIEIVKTCKKKR